MKKDKILVCECGSKKFRKSMDAMDNVVLTCNPPIYVSVYICEKCSKRHTIRKQNFPSPEGYRKVIL